jgi:ribosomal protein S12 methylthiotransferase
LHKKAAVVALGCPKNIVEAEYVLGILANRGFDLTNNVEQADIVLIHTCSFIKSALEESQKTIKKILALKKVRDIKVFVSGCLPQLLKENIYTQFPEIDGFVGTGDLDKICDIVLGKDCEIKFQAGGLNSCEFRVLSSNLPFAYLKIAEGCNHRCSFCIIPNLRGAYKSISQKEILSQGRRLVESNIAELILIAQDTTSYGTDIYNKFCLANLIEGLAKIPKLKWLRLLYAYPSGINKDLLKVILENENVCNYIDIPIQHISRNILSKMHRPLTTKKTIEALKKDFSDIVLRTSFIVGFPGETDRDIYELIDFINQGYFLFAGVFKYSDNPNAKSYKMQDKVLQEVCAARQIAVENAQYEVFKREIKKRSGASSEVLIENFTPCKSGYKIFARAKFQAPEIDGKVIFFSKQKPVIGSFKEILITGSRGYDILGKERSNELTK